MTLLEALEPMDAPRKEGTGAAQVDDEPEKPGRLIEVPVCGASPPDLPERKRVFAHDVMIQAGELADSSFRQLLRPFPDLLVALDRGEDVPLVRRAEALRWSRMRRMARPSVMNATTRITPWQRGQTSGSISYTRGWS